MHLKFDDLLQTRKLLLKVTANLSNEQLNKIPEGFNNNIAWNIAHLVVTQQLLCYKNSGLKCLVSEEMIEKYKKGTAPNGIIAAEEFDEIKELLLKLPVRLEDDYEVGIFQKYNTYTTSIGVTLNSVDDAVQFNMYHEGIHLGVILQLLKFI
ncbi:DinB family protein [Lutibacter sp. A80]|uniref:DinB family protein n=1 Tax=Lutibacter sp. A80 TaxID=2918453 RepID=UPI001F06E1D1|nr:DinB family protein [Lutibacter sp. A80]UMB59732.1 DinB family protein [Lutibacter sp. A80]